MQILIEGIREQEENSSMVMTSIAGPVYHFPQGHEPPDV
jgi:hypothetical protein